MTLERLHLMRHGETDWNVELRMQGHRDIPLNAAGRAQAAAAVPIVTALRPDIVVASDLRRASETAAEIARALRVPSTIDRRLRETRLGEWEGLTRTEVESRWPALWETWRHRGAQFAPPGGESRVEVASRAATVVDELDSGSHNSALLVTHGGLIVGLTGRLLGLGAESWGVLVGVANCHWVTLHRVAGHWRLHTYNGGPGSASGPVADEEIVDD